LFWLYFKGDFELFVLIIF